MRGLIVLLVICLGCVTLSDCFRHFSLSVKPSHGSTRLFVASPTSKFRVFKRKYRAPLPKDANAFNVPVTFEEVEENVLKVVEGELSDQECNLLCWRCLGYKYDATLKNFTNDGVMNRWKAIYPQPVDLIGLFNTEDEVIDRPVELASKELWRTIAEHYKDGLSEIREFEPIDVKDLTLNVARRIIIATWLIYFAGELIGKTPAQIEEEWDANRKEQNKQRTEFQRMLKKHMRDTKRFRVEPPSGEPKPKNRSQREPKGINKRDRRDADGL